MMQRESNSNTTVVPYDPRGVPDDLFDPRGSAHAVQIEGTTQWCKTHNMRIVPLQVHPANLKYPVISALLCKDTGDNLLRTPVEGKQIACFMIGGELRLCLPQLSQVLNDVLPIDNLADINRAFNDLSIYCKQANNVKLNIMKDADVLPRNTSQCSLITRSDCERVVALINRNINRHHYTPGSVYSTRLEGMRVAHNNFAHETIGKFYPGLYVLPDSKCIECLHPNCERFFSPKGFCHHYHGSMQERHVCHWGFQLTDWRHYITIPLDIEPSDYDRATEELAIIKEKFPKYNQPSYHPYLPQQQAGQSGSRPATISPDHHNHSEVSPPLPNHESNHKATTSNVPFTNRAFNCGKKLTDTLEMALKDVRNNIHLKPTPGMHGYQQAAPTVETNAAAAALYYGEAQQITSVHQKRKEGSKPWTPRSIQQQQPPPAPIAIRKHRQHKERGRPTPPPPPPPQHQQHRMSLIHQRTTPPNEAAAIQLPITERFAHHAANHQHPQYMIDNRFQTSPPGAAASLPPTPGVLPYYAAPFTFSQAPQAADVHRQQQLLDTNAPLVQWALALQRIQQELQVSVPRLPPSVLNPTAANAVGNLIPQHFNIDPAVSAAVATSRNGFVPYHDPSGISPLTVRRAPAMVVATETTRQQRSPPVAQKRPQQPLPAGAKQDEDVPTDLRVKRKKSPEEQKEEEQRELENTKDELGHFPFEKNDNGPTTFRVFAEHSRPQTAICQFIFEGELVEAVQAGRDHVTMVMEVAKRAHAAVADGKENAHGAMVSIREATSILTALLPPQDSRPAVPASQEQRSGRKRSRLDVNAAATASSSSSLMQIPRNYNKSSVEREIRKVTTIEVAAKAMQHAEVAGLLRVNEIRRKHTAAQRELVNDFERDERKSRKIEFTRRYRDAASYFEYKSCNKMFAGFYPNYETRAFSPAQQRRLSSNSGSPQQRSSPARSIKSA